MRLRVLRLSPHASRLTQKGFTLLEVLVALAIVAIALAAVARAVGVSTDSEAQVKERMLASWVAQNHYAELYARHTFPDLGSRFGNATEGGRSFVWEESVSATPNADFRRVEVMVRVPGQDHVAGRIVGYLSPVREPK
jgi:general secretion pathway protein I